MATVVVALLAAAAAALATAAGFRILMARRLSELAHVADPEQPAEPTASLTEARSRVERAVVHLQRGSEVGTASFGQLQAAADALPLGLVVMGGDDQVLLRNSTAAGFIGVRYADALVDEAVTANLRRALLGEPCAQTLEILGPPRRSVLVRAIPVDSTEGDVAIAIIEDVSERARLEAMRTDFVANISHELRTPIGAVALLAETIVDEPDPAVVRRMAGRMVTETTRVTRTIEDLLELSRLEQGGRPHTELVPVGLLVAEASDRVRALAAQQSVTVAVTEPSRRLTAVGDRRQLVSALANLLENGVKYSDPGTTVEVTAGTDGRWIWFRVADHGIGIPARDQDRIFERFYRVDRARARDTGGTGLGLAIVRHVATNHGGTVAVESAEGVGSTFTLQVPAGPGPVAISMSEAG